MKKQNQTTRPIINKVGSTQKEPRKVRVYFKSGNSTMLLCKLPHEAALQLESRLIRFLKRFDAKLEGNLIQTQ